MINRTKVIVALGAILGLSAGAWWGTTRGPEPLVVRVDGAVFEPLDSEGQPVRGPTWKTFVEARQARAAKRELTLRVEGRAFRFKQPEMGVELDTQALTRRYHTLDEARGIQDLTVSYRFDDATARAALEALAPAVRREPTDAQALVREHRMIRARAGAELDVEGTLAALRAAPVEEEMLLDAVMRPIPPKVTDEMVGPIDVSKVLAVYDTSFQGKAGARAVNIARAAEYLNGTILGPGAVFSFNRTVGARTHARGFVDAPVIVEDEMEKDVGGGVCQVATTLHAAARFGNLEVVRRRSHSRPSGYAPLGLDATVIDGKVDLRIKNPYDTPLLVHAFLPSRYVIRVELLGRLPEVKVDHSYFVTESTPFVRRVWTRDEVDQGEFERKQKGSPGYQVVSILKIEHPDGRIERQRYKSRYYPVPEVFWVGAGADLSDLPKLPKGATDTVIDGARDEDPELVDSDAAGDAATRSAPRSDNVGLGPAEPLL